jgi:hypothetical protein
VCSSEVAAEAPKFMAALQTYRNDLIEHRTKDEMTLNSAFWYFVSIIITSIIIIIIVIIIIIIIIISIIIIIIIVLQTYRNDLIEHRTKVVMTLNSASWYFVSFTVTRGGHGAPPFGTELGRCRHHHHYMIHDHDHHDHDHHHQDHHHHNHHHHCSVVVVVQVYHDQDADEAFVRDYFDRFELSDNLKRLANDHKTGLDFLFARMRYVRAHPV